MPSGPFRGRKFSVARQPIFGLYFAAVESQQFRRNFIVGPTQSGKSLCGFLIPACYFLFELQESIVIGLPDLALIKDKWADLRTIIEATRYRNLLPTEGAGSQGGASLTIRFQNNAMIRWMTGGGSDKSRAGWSSRILLVSETDGLDTAGPTSREADPMSQLEARTLAYGNRALVFGECTVSTTTGRTWTEYQSGTRSRIAIRCAQCRKFVTPEREHFVGFETATNIIAAGQQSHFACPICSAPWTEQDRTAANQDARLVHKGQELDADGNVIGPAPKTNTLAFRYSAANNLLMPMSEIGQKEFKAKNSPDEENEDRALSQFIWAVPPKSRTVDVTGFDAVQVITQRMTTETKGVPPAGTQIIAVGCDVGAWLCHWTAIALGTNGRVHVLEYGKIEVPQQIMAVEAAVVNALRQLRDEIIKPGFAGIVPALTLVDAGFLQSAVSSFCAESGAGFIASKGYGQSMGNRRLVRQTGSKVIGVGENYEVAQLIDGTRLLEFNADHWKSFMHARLKTPVGSAGAFTIFHSPDHLSYGKHLAAEKEVEIYVPGKGVTTRWEQISRVNHFGDATVLAILAGFAAGGLKITGSPAAAAATAPRRKEEQHENLPADYLFNYRGRW